MAQIQDVQTSIANLRADIYGDGADKIGIFERIRSLAVKVGLILTVLCAIGAFLGQLLEKVIFR